MINSECIFHLNRHISINFNKNSNLKRFGKTNYSRYSAANGYTTNGNQDFLWWVSFFPNQERSIFVADHQNIYMTSPLYYTKSYTLLNTMNTSNKLLIFALCATLCLDRIAGFSKAYDDHERQVSAFRTWSGLRDVICSYKKTKTKNWELVLWW